MLGILLPNALVFKMNLSLKMKSLLFLYTIYILTFFLVGRRN